MEQTLRSVVIVAFSWLLFMSIVQETSQDKKVTYLLSGPAENCISACASRGMPCVEVGGFPSNALHIFHSLNITCTTSEETDKYFFKDHPNYCIAGGWRGRCMGFKIPNATWHLTLCGRGHNPSIRRLCPCEKQISTTDSPSTPLPPPLTTTAIPSSSSTMTSTTAQTRVRDQYTSAETELSTWLIAVIAVAAVLSICCLLLVVLLVRKRRKRKSNGPPKIRSAPEHKNMKSAMDGSENIVYMESMVDIKKLSASSPTDNILYESSGSPYEPECELNELYASCEDENQTTRTSNNPIYQESIADEHRHEQSLAVDYEAGDFANEYASIDQIEL